MPEYRPWLVYLGMGPIERVWASIDDVSIRKYCWLTVSVRLSQRPRRLNRVPRDDLPVWAVPARNARMNAHIPMLRKEDKEESRV